MDDDEERPEDESKNFLCLRTFTVRVMIIIKSVARRAPKTITRITADEPLALKIELILTPELYSSLESLSKSLKNDSLSLSKLLPKLRSALGEN